MKSLLIVNPAAGHGRSEDTLALLHAALGPFVGEMLLTQERGDAEAAAYRAASQPGDFDAVLVAGGDGTVNEVVNGLLRGQPEGAPPLPLGLVPMGTQNVLAQELRIPQSNLPAIAEMLRAGRTRLVDVGKAGERYFLLMAGLGFDAAVVGDVLRPVKELIGPAAYAFALVGALAKYHSTSICLKLDDEEVRSEAFLIVVANAASYAYRQLRVAPFASLDDGWLDICVFERAPSDRFGFATQMMAALVRRHLRDPRVRYYRARHIEIHSTPPISVQLDGDMHGQTPLRLEVVPRVLSVFVP